MAYFADKEIKITINGKRLANVQRFNTTYSRERIIENNALTVPPTVMYIELTRAFFLGDPYRDEINFRALRDFTLEIKTPFHTATYKGCQWVGFYEEYDENNRLFETIKIASLECIFLG